MARTTRANPIDWARAVNSAALGPDHRAQLGREGGQEGLAQIVHQFGGQLLRAPAAGQQARPA